jgi:hypothetical protein
LFSLAIFSASFEKFFLLGLINSSRKGTKPKKTIAGKKVSHPLERKEIQTTIGSIKTDRYLNGFIWG